MLNPASITEYQQVLTGKLVASLLKLSAWSNQTKRYLLRFRKYLPLVAHLKYCLPNGETNPETNTPNLHTPIHLSCRTKHWPANHGQLGVNFKHWCASIFIRQMVHCNHYIPNMSTKKWSSSNGRSWA